MSAMPPNVGNPGYVQPGTGQPSDSDGGWEMQDTQLLPDLSRYPILQYFDSAHHPEDLKRISKPFEEQAIWLATYLPPGPEVSAGLRKLLEAKDCFVRSALELRS